MNDLLSTIIKNRIEPGVVLVFTDKETIYTSLYDRVFSCDQIIGRDYLLKGEDGIFIMDSSNENINLYHTIKRGEGIVGMDPCYMVIVCRTDTETLDKIETVTKMNLEYDLSVIDKSKHSYIVRRDNSIVTIKEEAYTFNKKGEFIRYIKRGNRIEYKEDQLTELIDSL